MSTRASGSFYGYKLHQIVCAITGLPLAWRVETANDLRALRVDVRRVRRQAAGRQMALPHG